MVTCYKKIIYKSYSSFKTKMISENNEKQKHEL